MTHSSSAKTVTIALTVAMVCSAMVTTAVLSLRPLQASLATLERHRIVLQLIGAEVQTSTDRREILSSFNALDTLLYDFSTGRENTTINAHAYDPWSDTAPQRAAPLNPLGLESLPAYAPVYRMQNASCANRIVLPIQGKGMWSNLYGYLALAGDLQSVTDLYIYQHGETPGIGDRILQTRWLESWRGKRVGSTSGEPRLSVTDDPSIPKELRVDVISGATITSQAVGRMVHFWLGPDGFGPLLDQLADTKGL